MKEPGAERPDDIDITVSATLDEFFNGSKKKVSYMRQVVGLDGRTLKQEEAFVNVFVKPGMLESKTLKMRGLGHQSVKNEPTNLNISFKMIPCVKGANSCKYERKGERDLLYRHEVSLTDVIQCKPIKVTTLDGRKLIIPVDQIHSPGSVKLVQGEGFKSGDAGEQRGDLYICFDVKFPTKLSVQQKQEVAEILC